MSFFTRVNTNVPFLPSDECHSENGTLKRNSDENASCTNVSDNCAEVNNRETASGNDDNNATQSNKESGRYEYVVDRVLGVEV